jgi:hypothetical protein
MRKSVQRTLGNFSLPPTACISRHQLASGRYRLLQEPQTSTRSRGLSLPASPISSLCPDSAQARRPCSSVKDRRLECPSRSVYVLMFFSSGIPALRPCRSTLVSPTILVECSLIALRHLHAARNGDRLGCSNRRGLRRRSGMALRDRPARDDEDFGDIYEGGELVGKVERVKGSLVVYREFVDDSDPA